MRHFLRNEFGVFSMDTHLLYILLFMGGLGVLLMTIFFLITMQRTMESVSPDLREMEPQLAWLMLIPLFSYVWRIILILRLADSLEEEFRRRKIEIMEARPGVGLGLTWAFLTAASFLISFLDVPAVFYILFLSGLTCWILYWVKIVSYRNLLLQSGPWQRFAPYMYMSFPPPQYYPQNFPPPPFPPPQQNFPPPPNFPPAPFPPVPPPDDLSRWMHPDDKPPEKS